MKCFLCSALLVLSISLTACSKAPTYVPTIEVDSTPIALPTKVADLMECGYSVLACDSPTVTKGVGDVVYFANDAGYVITADVRTKESESEIADSYIVSILADKANTRGTELSIDGLTFESTEEDVVKVFGESTFDVDGYAGYIKYLDDTEENSMAVLVEDGSVVRIEVSNALGFE